jgi:hypothetical protein
MEILVYFSRFGILYEEKSGNPGFQVVLWEGHERMDFFIFCSSRKLTKNPQTKRFHARKKSFGQKKVFL